MRRLVSQMKRALGLAVIRLIDDAGPYQKVQLDLGPIGPDGQPLQLRDETYVLQHFGFTSHPPRGSDAALIALGGDANQVVVIATGNREYRMTGLPEGGVAIHDQSGNYFKLTDDGIESVGTTWTHTGPLILQGDLTVDGATVLDGTLQVTGDATLDANLSVAGSAAITGSVTAEGDITDRSGSNSVTLFSLRTKYNAHAHGGVSPGGMTSATTNQPAT
jgi:phage baseplate assembly protein V